MEQLPDPEVVMREVMREGVMKMDSGAIGTDPEVVEIAMTFVGQIVLLIGLLIGLVA